MFRPLSRARRRAAFLAAVAALLAVLGTVTLPASASAADGDAPPCAPLAAAPFGDPGDAVGHASLAPGETSCFTVSAVAGVYELSLQESAGTLEVTPPAPLANSAPPKITGTAAVSATVKAGAGGWSAAVSRYAYQWRADGKAISGATASAYTVPPSLLGRKLTVTVTAVRTGWNNGSATSAAVGVARGAAPRATKAPVISGTAKVGRTLKVSAGTWSPASTLSCQWYANGRAIKGATHTTLALKTAQRGTRITVKVTARSAGRDNGSATTKATAAVGR